MNKIFFLLFFYASSLSIQAQNSESDRSSARVLCSMQPCAVQSLAGFGLFNNEISSSNCLDKPFPETNSIWFTWAIDQTGELAFTLLPVVSSDDVDFILYKIVENGDLKTTLTEVRCMTSGKILGSNDGETNLCTGATGLSSTSFDNNESPGCSASQDNFLQQLHVNQGEQYLLFVNNYKSCNGFILEFSGTCSFTEQNGKCNEITSSLPYIPSLNGNIKFSQVYPNPVTDELILNVSSASEIDGIIQIIDIRGTIVKTQSATFLNGENTIRIPVDDIQSGVWFIKATSGPSSCISRFYRG
jgi:hypothetical protein